MTTRPSAAPVLVIGGSGFLGRHVVAALRQRGRSVVVVSRRPAPDGLAWEPLDITPEASPALRAVIERTAPSVVVNAMGSIWGPAPADMWEAVALPSLTLVETLANLDAPPRYVHLGSVLELGSVEAGQRIDGDTQPHDPAPYGAAKLAVTQRVQELFREGRLTGLILRIGNISGPGSPITSLLGRVAAALAEAGEGEATIRLDRLVARRDFVDVRDVADAIVLAVESSVTGVLLDIGRGEAVPVRTLVQWMIDASATPARLIEAGPHRAHSAEQWTCVDPNAAERVLGWRPSRSLRDSVAAHLAEVRAEQGVEA